MELFIIIGIPILIIIYAAYRIKRDNDDEQYQDTKSSLSQSKGLNYKPLTSKEVNSKYETSRNNSTEYSSVKTSSVKRGIVYAYKKDFDDSAIEQLHSRYIAFDVETTGLSPYTDRIIEVGAVLFENEQPIKQFGTLINPKIKIPSSATAVNHITDEMVYNAPSEEKVYTDLVHCLGDALDGQTLLCAHNAKFDMDFLCQTLIRLGYNGKIYYVDTLSISRGMNLGLDNYKQPTLAEHFAIVNEQEHRAVSDAKTCGIILSKLLDLKREEKERERLKAETQQNLIKSYHEKRNEITINPIHNRVPLNEILTSSKNTEGFSYWNTGETLRKGDDIQLAIQLYDKARYSGYSEPALYESYAKAYRQLKDYDNEIAILDEGILRNQNSHHCEALETRRYKAVCLFIKRQQKLQAEQEKLQKKQEKQNTTYKTETGPKKSKGRAVLQLSDDMTLIRKFESIAEAERVTGVNSKSIRDAAKGIQKHAGSFVWRYADEGDNRNID